MLKTILVVAGLLASSHAFATTGSYRCEGPRLSPNDSDPVTVTWDSNPSPYGIPSRVVLGLRGALVFGQDKEKDSIDGFWASPKRIWIKTLSGGKEMFILKAVNDGNEYKGQLRIQGKIYPVTCSGPR